MNEYMENNCLDWGDTISDDGKDFALLPEGDYEFKVTGFERGRHEGSDKIGPCNKAMLNLYIETDTAKANIKVDLFLHKMVEWKLSSFFRAIGQKKHGEKLVMDWNKVNGASGKCHVKQKEYVNKYGDTKVYNEVDRFYDSDADVATVNNKTNAPTGFVELAPGDDLPF